MGEKHTVSIEKKHGDWVSDGQMMDYFWEATDGQSIGRGATKSEALSSLAKALSAGAAITALAETS